MVWRAGFDHAQAIRYALDMGIDSDGGLTESDVEDHARGFSADAGQCFQGRASIGDFSSVSFNQQAAKLDDVFGFPTVKADVFDEGRHAIHTQRKHRCWRVGHGVELARGDIHRFVGGLGREHHRDQQFKRRGVFQIAFR